MAPVSLKVVVVGGGIGGAAAALRLGQAGAEVTLLEAGEALGGLVVSLEVAGTPIECFYHHVFPHESHVISLIGEMGLAHRLDWLPGSMGVYTQDKVWPFTTPKDLLAFKPLALADRLRAGVGALRLAREKDWERLDQVRARDWLASVTGPRVTEVVWDPLLHQKFGSAAPDVPAAWMWGRLQQRSGARGSSAARGRKSSSEGRKKGELLGYMRGGFRQLFDALAVALGSTGVDVRTGTLASRIVTDGSGVTGVELSSGETLPADAVMYTGALPRLAGLVEQGQADPRWLASAGLGALCVVLELARPLGDVYWVNVCDAQLPFGGIIEHTNLVPSQDYGGRRVVYLSRYFTADEDVATVDPRSEADRWVGLLRERFPVLGPSDVLGVHPFRTPYAAPLVHLGYLDAIPPRRSHISGLYLSTTANIYPQDRGMSEGIRTATETAEFILADHALATNPA